MYLWKTLDVDVALAGRMAGELALPEPVARVLQGLGLTGVEQVGRFMNPRLADLGDPLLVAGMGPAVERIWRAIERRESVAVFGDYDVDGITSTCLLIKLLSRFGLQVAPWMPNRLSEGFGFSVIALQRCLREFRPSLVITADCGTNAADAVKAAAGEGIDVVVTDHHEPVGALAGACAVVNPKLGSDDDLKRLAGVGVAFKLCHALIKHGRTLDDAQAQGVDLREYLDLVALGTVADIVPLRGENRIFVRHGLNGFVNTPSVGLRALIDAANIREAVDTYHLGFYLGPRLNAAGRLGGADVALELLLTDHAPRATKLAMELNATNRERQELEHRILAEALLEIEAQFDSANLFGIAVGKEGWHKGVVGNVASRLASRRNRPSVVIAFEPDGAGRGSCRSIPRFNILKSLEQCADLLVEFGGHAMAAGIDIKRERFPEFQKRFNALVRSELENSDLRPVLSISAWVELGDIDECLMKGVEALRPFGLQNPTPVWAVRNVLLPAAPRRVGQSKNHLAFTVESGRGARLRAIGFGMGDRAIPDGPLDIAFQLRRDSRNTGDFELLLQDIRASA